MTRTTVANSTFALDGFFSFFSKQTNRKFNKRRFNSVKYRIHSQEKPCFIRPSAKPLKAIKI